MKQSSFLKDFFAFSLYIWAITLPFGFFYSVKTFGLLVFASIITTRKKDYKLNTESFLLLLLYLIIMISLMLNHEVLVSQNILFKYIPLLLTPLLVLNKNFEKIELINFVRIFLIGIVMSVLANYTVAGYKSMLTGQNYFIRGNWVTLNLFLDRAYYSMILIIGVILMVKYKTQFNKIIFYFVIILLILTLYFLSSKSGQISFLLISFIYAISKLKRKRWKITAFVLIICAVGILSKYNYRFKQLYTQIETQIINRDQSKPIRHSQARVNIWKIAVNNLDHQYFGYGPKNLSKTLDQLYMANGFELYAERSYNLHSQFLGFYYKYGSIALLILITYLIFQYVKANFLIRILYILLVFNFLFESILERADGIQIFVLIFVLGLVYKRE